MSYVNPLHPPVRAGQQSRFSSINRALEPALDSPTRRRVPQQIYVPNSKGMPAPGRRHAPITFDHPGYSKQGVQMREFVSRSSSALASTVQGAGDAVLAHTGISRITLRIMWPGYDHLNWENVIELGVPGYGPITRAQLGAVVSQHFARFMEVRSPVVLA
ncbi:hypothetical protein C0993_007890 [Termitomyces sp. T159_Od127]|nr:hypothetical protein C0993_007890 [Termitomyces sp. T159_Od127]